MEDQASAHEINSQVVRRAEMWTHHQVLVRLIAAFTMQAKKNKIEAAEASYRQSTFAACPHLVLKMKTANSRLLQLFDLEYSWLVRNNMMDAKPPQA